MRSTTDLSSSVSPPTISSATSLPSSAAVSRTTRRKREKVSPIGTMRSCSVPLRISSTRRLICWLASISAPWRVWRASSEAPALAMTSSPSRLITASSRSACTRMKRLVVARLAAGCAAPWPCRAARPWRRRVRSRRIAASAPAPALRRRGVGVDLQRAVVAHEAEGGFDRVARPRRCRSSKAKPRWQLSGSSASSAGTASTSQRDRRDRAECRARSSGSPAGPCRCGRCRRRSATDTCQRLHRPAARRRRGAAVARRLPRRRRRRSACRRATRASRVCLGRRRRRCRSLRLADQHADLVVALQQQRAELRRQRELAFAQAVEQRLDVVREGHHRVEAEDAGRALDGVGAAEQRVEQLAVVRRVLELQQQLLERSRSAPAPR